MYQAPKESKVYWITLNNGMKVEIDYYVYETYTHSFANFYYYKEDCVTGSGTGREPKKAIANALRDLKSELKKFYQSQCEIIQTHVPGTEHKATIFILPREDYE